MFREKLMSIDELIEAVYKYAETRRRLGNLSKVVLTKNPYEIQPCTEDNKEEFDKAQQELAMVLDTYIESRVKAVLESIKKSEQGRNTV